MNNIFFDSWESIVRSVVITILAYISLILFLRFSGKRTLSKMNAFDFVVTIALGSCLATVALDKNVALADGCLVFLLLILLQFTVTWLSVRVSQFRNLITNNPSLLLFKGKLLPKVLKRERISLEELYVAARAKGIAKLEDIDVIILETTGIITVIPKIEVANAETLKDVDNCR